MLTEIDEDEQGVAYSVELPAAIDDCSVAGHGSSSSASVPDEDIRDSVGHFSY